MTTLLILLLALSSFALIWHLVGFPTTMAIIASRRKSPAGKPFDLPRFSIIIPAHNEEQVIAARIGNVDDLDYPVDKFEVIVVASGCEDRTAEIVDHQMRKRGDAAARLRLITQDERRGKASAINLGCENSTGDIVLVTDANALFSENVLVELAREFSDPSIGGAGGRYVVSNPEAGLAASEAFYWDLESVMRIGETQIDSACLFHGEIAAWRRGLVLADTECVSEDLDLAIQIRRKGFRIGYAQDAVAYERSPFGANEQILRRKRTAIGTLQCMRKHAQYFLFPRDFYGGLIFPSHKGLVMFSPFFLGTIPILYLLISDLSLVVWHLVGSIAVFGILLAALGSLCPRVLRSTLEGTTSRRVSFRSLWRIGVYVLLNEYLLLLAWRDFLLGRYTVKWRRAESTRVVEVGAD